MIIWLLLPGMLLLSACSKAQEEGGQKSGARTATEEGTKGGIEAVDFALTDIDGDSVRLSDYRGKVVILDFWATWCPPCVREIPHFNELAREFGDRGLVVLGVSVDREGVIAVNRFKRKIPIDYRVVMVDQQTFETYQSYLPPTERGGIPFSFIIDRKGTIRQHYVGYRPKEIFEEAVKPLL